MNSKNLTRKPVALSHRFLQSLSPMDVAYRIPDSKCAGLAVRVARSGVISFDLAFRVSRLNKFRRLSLGKFPDVRLEAARNRANELTRAARFGEDKLASEEDARATAANRVSVDSLITEYVVRRVKGRLRTWKEIESRLRRALGTELMKSADDLRRRDVRRLLDSVVDRGYVREAEQRRVTLNSFFKWALAQDYIEINPMIGLTSYGRSPPRERTLTSDEIRCFWKWMDNELPPYPAAVLRLEFLLGARCSEIGGMSVEEFDTEQWIWTLPAERSKNKKLRVTPIVGLARDILRDRLDLIKQGGLFLTDTGKPLTSSHLGHFLLARTLPIAKFGTHDIRRTVATMMAEQLNISLDTIARVIGHQAGERSVRTLATHYVKSHFLVQKTNALLSWDTHFKGILDGLEQRHNVVQLRS